MKHRLSNLWKVIPALAVILLLSGAVPSAWGAQKVPITFNNFHGYNGTVKYIKDVAQAYPNITKLLEIGKSTMDRPIYVLVISNMRTGETIDKYIPLRNSRKENVQNVTPMQSYQGKPGNFFCGATHGNEYTGTEVCLYIIDKLVSGYGEDETITQRIDGQTFYICPIVNPDGVYNSVEKGIPQRQNSLMKDDDGDGKINEDGPDDLNGDGLITQFRYKDPEGRYVIDDVDSRLMVRLGGRGNTEVVTEKERYSVISEDKDNDGDGRRGEDSERGIDVNRNYPEGWFTEDILPGGQGVYPTSSPEAQAMVEFMVNHRNILIAQFYHTSGGFTYVPPGTGPHTNVPPKDRAVFDFVMGKKYLEVNGMEVPEAWKNPQNLPQIKEELAKTSKNKYAIARGYEWPEGWRASYNDIQDRIYGYGLQMDWMYSQYGAYALTTELWNPGNDMKGLLDLEEGASRTDQERALLKYQDEKFDGKLFKSWTKFTHPELGEGEIGGWLPQYSRNNALPGEVLIDICDRHWKYEFWRTGLQPDVMITEVKAEVLSTSKAVDGGSVSQSGDQVTVNKGRSGGNIKIVKVTAVIENKGLLATHIAAGVNLPGNRDDVVWLVGDRDKITFLQGTAFQRLGMLEGTMSIPGVSARGGSGGGTQATGQRRGRGLQPAEVTAGGAKRTVTWIVSVEGNTPLKIVVTSQKGGTKVKNVEINQDGGVS
ncbi:M14 family metallopeptidase [Acidobacteriota bacterium]